ncbi:tRNA epoxyqueuosine(34) reductase QueG [Magnetospirillum fulvum]|uniref:Epoxyqueuosine reductase n=1 Tax=Magnetospirillum fulvum TaxID=1082 RepID=A0A1H6IQI3_MAGFU|nr:tRNA epoxyqueuosine(34) reductase QueG [Magnetospirillum fulvum]SEH48876.1 epoxyqueuosine reductase [Magnetospirillum fulvum]
MKAGIRAQALRLGFCDVGFAPVAGLAVWSEGLTGFLAEGRHGEMDWLADTAERRVRPQALWPQARTAIVLATSHAPPDDPQAATRLPDRGAICAYARGRDYHDVIKKRLKALGRWLAEGYGAEVRACVDTAPVMEKPLAQQAGLGWQGRHTLLVSRRFGGWVFLSELLTDLDLPPDPPESDHCGTCRACVEACPTGALDGTGRIDPRLCLSYHTIEAKAPMPESLRSRMGNRIYGCDACQAACPWVRRSIPASPDFLPRIEAMLPRLGDLAQLDEADFRALFAGTPVKRVGRDRFVVTVLIAIGNSGRRELRPLVERLRLDPAAEVRAMAVWAASALGGEGAGEL